MAEETRVGVVVPNLFLRIPVDSAVRDAGAEPVALTTPGDAESRRCSLVIVDLDAVAMTDLDAIPRLIAGGVVVLAFGPDVHKERLVAARGAGAVALPRSAFLQHLPELLATALTTASGG